MLLVLFKVGAERYGIDAQSLIEIIPAVPLRPQRGAPPGCVGLLSHRERLVPVVDLALMMSGSVAAGRLSTRILVARYRPGPSDARIGLLVEHATDARAYDPAQLMDPGLVAPDAPYLGKIARFDSELVQVVEVTDLLTPAVRAALYPGGASG